MNNYHIYEEIGRGKYSVVYKGRYKKSIEYIAVKSLEKDRRPKVLNEVKILTDLDHDHILKFYKWYETKNHLWIIFEYCAGGDLNQIIEQDQSLTETVVRQFGLDLLSGIQYLHSKGIIYCDLKPNNILINEFGNLKLSDFGQAKRIVDLISSQSDKQNTKRGNPFYMAPELFQDVGVYSFQSDLWAFGCFLYEIGCGKPPFSSKSLINLVELIVDAQTPSIEKFSPEFNDLILRLLVKDPMKRITWDDLIDHPFWQNEKLNKNVAIPAQPHFDKWVQNYYDPKQFKFQNIPPLNQKENKFPQQLDQQLNFEASSLQKKGGGKIDPLRLSIQVAKDQQQQQNNYTNEQNGYDIQLNRNQEIGWGGEQMGNNDDEDFENNNNNQFNQQQNQQQQQLQDDQINVEKFGNYKKQLDNNSHIKQGIKKGSDLNEIQTQYLQQQNLMPGSQTPKSPIDGFQTPVARANKQVPLDQLFTHNSDNAVKPIIGNKDIEKLPEVSYNVNSLPFKSYSPEDVINNVESTEIEQHFEEIYSSLILVNSDKLNILNYFENIVQHSNVSNRLINSQFMNLLLKLLKASKIILVKIRLASIIGLLIRHSTVIENELSQLNIPGVMLEVLQLEKQEKVKRRVIAALGEYLFYAATQIDEDPNNTCWEIKQNCYIGLLNLLKNNQEDELVKFYAAKTIENITAQSEKTGKQFATQDMVSAISSVYFTSKNEQLKICATISLTHMAVLNNDLIEFIINKFSKHLINIFTGVDTSTRVQQAFLTIINMQILNSGNLLQSLVDQEQEFTNSVVHLLDSQNIVVRGKAILTIILLIKINAVTMIFLSENKFFTLLEKLQRDTYKYVQQCLHHMQELLYEMLPQILKTLLDEFAKMQGSDFQQFLLDQNYTSQNDDEGNSKNKKMILPGNLQFLEVIMQYLNSNTLKLQVYTPKYLETIFAFIEFCDFSNDSIYNNFQKQSSTNNNNNGENQNEEEKITSNVIENTKSYLFQLYEIIIRNNKLVLNNHQFFIQNLIPNLCKKVFTSQQVDLRFNNLKFCINILSQIMNDPHIYDNKKVHGKQLNDFLLQEIVPNINQILNDLDPVPFYGLRLVNLLVEQNQSLFVSALRRQKLHLTFYEFLQKDHQRMTKNTLKILCQLISHSETPLDELLKAKVLQNSTEILKAHISTQQDWAIEDTLEILLLMFAKLWEILQAQNFTLQIPDYQQPQQIQNKNNNSQNFFPYENCRPYMQFYETIVSISDIFFSQLVTTDFAIQEKSSLICMYLIYIFSEQKNTISKVLTPANLKFVSQAIINQNQIQNNQNQLQINLVQNNQSHVNSTVIQTLNNSQLKRLCRVLTQGLKISSLQNLEIVNESNQDFLSQSLEIMNKNEDPIILAYVQEIFNIIQPNRNR